MEKTMTTLQEIRDTRKEERAYYESLRDKQLYLNIVKKIILVCDEIDGLSSSLKMFDYQNAEKMANNFISSTGNDIDSLLEKTDSYFSEEVCQELIHACSNDFYFTSLHIEGVPNDSSSKPLYFKIGADVQVYYDELKAEVSKTLAESASDL